MPATSSRRRWTSCGWLFAALAIHAGAASAQPTGNPKGTLAPGTQGAGVKPPATRPPQASTYPELDEKLGPPSARTQRTEPPGGGLAGGLTRTDPQDAQPNRKGTTGRGSAQPRPESPQR